jgi:hypothetical protein
MTMLREAKVPKKAVLSVSPWCTDMSLGRCRVRARQSATGWFSTPTRATGCRPSTLYPKWAHSIYGYAYHRPADAPRVR